jgi:hypothetical protein
MIENLQIEAWKTALGQKALKTGIINDPQWLNQLNDPMPVWAVLQIALQMIDIIDPPSNSYD